MRAATSARRSPTRAEVAPRTSPSAKITVRVPDALITRNAPLVRAWAITLISSGKAMWARSPARMTDAGGSHTAWLQTPTSRSSGAGASQ